MESDGWLSTRNKPKTEPIKKVFRRRASLPKRVRPLGEFVLSQGAAPDELLKTRKQSHLTQFFTTSNTKYADAGGACVDVCQTHPTGRAGPAASHLEQTSRVHASHTDNCSHFERQHEDLIDSKLGKQRTHSSGAIELQQHQLHGFSSSKRKRKIGPHDDFGGCETGTNTDRHTPTVSGSDDDEDVTSEAEDTQHPEVGRKRRRHASTSSDDSQHIVSPYVLHSHIRCSGSQLTSCNGSSHRRHQAATASQDNSPKDTSQDLPVRDLQHKKLLAAVCGEGGDSGVSDQSPGSMSYPASTYSPDQQSHSPASSADPGSDTVEPLGQTQTWQDTADLSLPGSGDSVEEPGMSFSQFTLSQSAVSPEGVWPGETLSQLGVDASVERGVGMEGSLQLESQFTLRSQRDYYDARERDWLAAQLAAERHQHEAQ